MIVYFSKVAKRNMSIPILLLPLPPIALPGGKCPGHFPRTIPPDKSPSQLGQFPLYRSKRNLKVTYIHTCMHTCIQIYMYAYIHIFMHTYTLKYSDIY